MRTFEVIMIIISSGIFTSLLALFYRFGKNQERQDGFFKSIDERFNRVDERFHEMQSKIDEMQHSITDIDKRLYGIETVLHMKDCCVLKQDQNLRKAE